MNDNETTIIVSAINDTKISASLSCEYEEMLAARERLIAGETTPEQECQRLGLDYQLVQKQIARERRCLETLNEVVEDQE